MEKRWELRGTGTRLLQLGERQYRGKAATDLGLVRPPDRDGLNYPA